MRFKSRRPAREAALKSLYQIEIGKSNVDDAVAEMRENASFDEGLIAYAEVLIRGAHNHADDIRRALEERLQDWDYSRLAVVDRCLLRIGAFELMFCEEVPTAVAMNEAIELAKKYSTAESGKFVNGILGRLPKQGVSQEVIEEEVPPEEIATTEETVDEASPEWAEIAESGALKKNEGELQI